MELSDKTNGQLNTCSLKPHPKLNIKYELGNHMFDIYLGLNVMVESIDGDEVTFDAGIHLMNFDKWKTERWEKTFKTNFRYSLNPKTKEHEDRFEEPKITF